MLSVPKLYVLFKIVRHRHIHYGKVLGHIINSLEMFPKTMRKTAIILHFLYQMRLIIKRYFFTFGTFLTLGPKVGFKPDSGLLRKLLIVASDLQFRSITECGPVALDNYVSVMQHYSWDVKHCNFVALQLHSWPLIPQANTHLFGFLCIFYSYQHPNKSEKDR